MKEIKDFITEFLKAEALATEASTKPNLDDFNKKLEYMNNFCVKALHNKFGMLPLTKLEDDDFYEEWKIVGPRNPRDVYKISLYNDKTHGDMYVIYVSPKSPNNKVFLYGECLFVTKIHGELKIVKNYTFGDRMKIKDKFEAGQGLEDISFKTLKKPIEIERYKEPEDDDDAMEHYNKDI